MRFSLATLVLLVLWIGALMAVWVRREPWICVVENEARLNQNLTRIAPDSLRYSYLEPSSILIGEPTTTEPVFLARLYPSKGPIRWGFTTDDEYIAVYFNTNRAGVPFVSIYHRRFPEWWWGHFYRPEVWLAIALSGLLIWRAIKSRRDTRAEDPSLYQPGAKPQVDCLKVQRAESPI